jgi:hypothetical protein
LAADSLAPQCESTNDQPSHVLTTASLTAARPLPGTQVSLFKSKINQNASYSIQPRFITALPSPRRRLPPSMRQGTFSWVHGAGGAPAAPPRPRLEHSIHSDRQTATGERPRSRKGPSRRGKRTRSSRWAAAGGRRQKAGGRVPVMSGRQASVFLHPLPSPSPLLQAIFAYFERRLCLCVLAYPCCPGPSFGSLVSPCRHGGARSSKLAGHWLPGVSRTTNWSQARDGL